jgi:hypothetical protein
LKFKQLQFIPDKTVPNYYVANIDLGAFKKEYRVFLSQNGEWLVYEDYKFPEEEKVIESFEQGRAFAQELFEKSCNKVINSMLEDNLERG